MFKAVSLGEAGMAELSDLRSKVFKIAGIAQLVEHNLAKVGVASSSLVSRSI